MTRTLLTTPRLVLREPAADDADLVSAYFARNAQRFAPWMNDVTLGRSGGDWVSWQRARSELGWAKAFLVLACEELAGIVELDSISAGVEAGALLAYSVDGEFEGRGLASEAVAAVVHFAFDDLHLEQLVAHFHPQNERSRKLLERAGFAIQPAAPEVPLSVHAPRPRRAIALLRSPASQGPTK